MADDDVTLDAYELWMDRDGVPEDQEEVCWVCKGVTWLPEGSPCLACRGTGVRRRRA